MQKINKKENIKIAEFQWFQVETKVRQYVHDLLQPFQKRQIEQSTKIGDLKRQVTAMKQKLNEHSFLLGKSKETPAFFVQMEAKLKQTTDGFMSLKFENKKVIQDLKSKLNFYDQKMNKTDIILKMAENQRRARVADKQQFHLKLQKQMKIVMQVIKTQQNSMSMLGSTFKTNIRNLEEKFLAIQNKFRTSQSKQKSIGNQVTLIRNQQLKLEQRITKNDHYVVQLQKRVIKIQDNNDLAKKFISLVDEIRTRFYFLENYVDKYLPLFVQSQISDTLSSCITGRNRRALCLYQEKIFNQLNQYIIRNQNTFQLKEAIESYISCIQKIILRNKKYVIKLKVQKQMKIGNKLYDMHVLENMEEEQDDDIKKAPLMQMTVPQDKIKLIIDKSWREISKDLRSEINQNLNTAKNWLTQMQQSLDIRTLKIEDKIQRNIQEIKKIQTDLKLEIEYMARENTQIIQSQNQVRNIFQDNKQLMKQLTHFASIMNHIIIQDQIDRQGIALYGLKQTSKQKQKPNISIQSKCFSCSGFPASTLSAFKMACLAYNPSNVLIQGKQYKRQQILEVATKILQVIKQKLTSQEKRIPTTIQTQRQKNQRGSTRQQSSQSQYRTIQSSRRMLPSVSGIKQKRNLQIAKKQLIYKQSPSQSFYF